MSKKKNYSMKELIQQTLFGTKPEKEIVEEKNEKEKIILNATRESCRNNPKLRVTVNCGIRNALIDLPVKFPAYCNPYEASLIELVRIYCRQPYLPDGTIMRELRRMGKTKCIDTQKGIYEQL